ncbi:MAG: DUF4240 domain-containing protein [Chloroflexota bacterium]
MTLEEFWIWVEQINKHKFPYHADKINFMITSLTILSPVEIMDFDRILDERIANAYNANLWNAAIAIYCECSSYEFQSLCAWLVFSGKYNYEKVLTQIEYIKNVIPDEDVREDSYISFAETSYEVVTGEEMPLQKRIMKQVTGNVVKTYKEARSLYPNLATKFENCEDKPYL